MKIEEIKDKLEKSTIAVSTIMKNVDEIDNGDVIPDIPIVNVSSASTIESVVVETLNVSVSNTVPVNDKLEEITRQSIIDTNSSSTPMNQESTFVKILETSSMTDVVLIKSVLDSEDIQYYLQGENTMSVRGGGPVVLMVADIDATKAIEALKPLDLKFMGPWLSTWD